MKKTQVTEIPDEWLRDLTHLEILDVRFNPITSLPNKALFVRLGNLDTVKLQGTDLRCDSTMCWIKVIPMKPVCNDHFYIKIYYL